MTSDSDDRVVRLQPRTRVVDSAAVSIERHSDSSHIVTVHEDLPPEERQRGVSRLVMQAAATLWGSHFEGCVAMVMIGADGTHTTLTQMPPESDEQRDWIRRQMAAATETLLRSDTP